jgi:hypothetical protein
MASTVFFNGELLTSPQSVSAVNDTAFAPASPTVGNVLAILGQAGGGQPNVPLVFTDPTTAAATLLSGDLCTAVVKAFAASTDASNGVNAPSKIIAIRTDEATQATLELSSGGTPVLSLAAVQYGISGNLVSVKVEDGSVSGFAVSVQKGSALFSQDNVGLTPFSVGYSGTQASATIQVSPATVVLSAPAGTVLATIDLASYTTATQLVGAINAVPGFTATLTPGADYAATLNGLDTIPATAVPISPLAPLGITANLQALVAFFNGSAQNLVTATALGGVPPAVQDWTFLTGGSETAAMEADWANALSVLQTQDVQGIVVLTPLPAVWAALDAHVQFMSAAGKMERRAFVGPDVGTTLVQYIAFKGLLNSDRTAIVGPGYYDFDAAGALTLLPAYQTAVLIAAGFCGSSPGEPMTNKSFTARGLEIDFKNPTDTDQLIDAGICVLENDNSVYNCTRSISTWITNNNYNRVEISCGYATDYVTRTVREACDVVRGRGASPQQLKRAIGIANTTLANLAKPAPIGPGVIVGDANSPAFQNVTGTISGDTMTIQYECSPVIPLNFILNSVAIVPYSGTASA